MGAPRRFLARRGSGEIEPLAHLRGERERHGVGRPRSHRVARCRGARSRRRSPATRSRRSTRSNAPSGALAARVHARERRVDVELEQQHEIRDRKLGLAARRGSRAGRDRSRPVGDGREEVAVRQHGAAAGERGLDAARDVLAAILDEPAQLFARARRRARRARAIARMRRPIGPSVGSRVTTTSRPRAAQRRGEPRDCVVLPQPSRPSSATRIPRFTATACTRVHAPRVGARARMQRLEITCARAFARRAASRALARRLLSRRPVPSGTPATPL